MGFLIRWIFAFVLLAATYNPTQWNFVRWSMANFETNLSVTVLFALILLVGYIIYLRATLRSIGIFGMVLVLAVVGTLLIAGVIVKSGVQAGFMRRLDPGLKA